MKNQKHIGSITFNFLEHNAVSKNGRVYPAHVVSEAVTAARADLVKGIPLTSFATHDYALAEDPTKMIGRIGDIWEEGTTVKGRVDLFDTQIARDLAAAVKGEGLKTVSLRAAEFKMGKEQVDVQGVKMDAVERFRLAGIDFAMRPGIDMAQVQSYVLESTQEHPSAYQRDVVPCSTEADKAPLVQLLEDGSEDMTPEEVRKLIKEEREALEKAEREATERSSHSHPHDHMGGDGKKYCHEHKHNHDAADSKQEDHLHEHGNPYENLGAFHLKDLVRAVGERTDAYAAKEDDKALLTAVVPSIMEVAGKLVKSGLATIDESLIPTSYKESAAQGGKDLLESQNRENTLSETNAVLTETNASLTKQLTEAQAKLTEAETEKAKLAEKVVEAAKSGGRRVPIGLMLEAATEAVPDLEREVDPDEDPKRTYMRLMGGLAAAITRDYPNVDQA